MIDPAELALAQAYSQLAANPAFTNLLGWLQEDVNLREHDAREASVSEPTRVWKARFQSWQAAAQVLASIQGRMEDMRRFEQDAQQELDNERAVAGDRAGRSGW